MVWVRNDVALQDRDRTVILSHQRARDGLEPEELLRGVDSGISRTGALDHPLGAVGASRPADHAGDEELPGPSPVRQSWRRRQAVRLMEQPPRSPDIEVGIRRRHEPQLALHKAVTLREAARAFVAPPLRLAELCQIV